MTVSYKLLFLKSFDKDIRKLNHSLIPHIIEKTLSLENNPRPQQSKKMRGADNEYRLRIGDYRVFYTIDDTKKEITICHVTHRREAYR